MLTLPMLLWATLVFSRSLALPGRAPKLAALLTLVFMVTLFFEMLYTGRTHQWRRIFFVTLGVMFPVGFIWELLQTRGSMSIPMGQMLSGDVPFCFLAIPMMILPGVFTRTLIFPGSILPTAHNTHAVASMVGMWLAGTLVLGKAWCSFGCFFGGMDEGFAAIPRKSLIKRIRPGWRLVPWAILVAVVLLSLALFEPVYCTWLCPFKTVTEYPAVQSVETAIQAVIFVILFVALVVVLPLLTRKRTQCAFFCPFGPFQSLSNYLNIFEIRIDRDKCLSCVTCKRDCPTMAVDEKSVQAGRVRLTCMKCGACVDRCPKGAALWHIKGTPLTARPETARLLFLYAAWGFATMLGGNIIARSLSKLLGVIG
jgi:ferredoxin